MRIWKVLLSLIIVGAFAGAAFASAAQLNLNSQGVQAGNIVIRGCQGDIPVSLNFDTQFNGTAFVVHGVVIGGINERCNGHKMHVVLTFADGSFQDLGEFTLSVPPPNMEILLSPEPLASDLTDAHVLIK